MAIRILAHAALCLVILGAFGAAASGAEDSRTIDPSGFELTFSEEFDSLDVSAWGPGTRWIAHTPWNGDFGDGSFADPRPGFPFTVEDGVLRIEARKADDGSWESGLLASVDREWNGFAQQYGYFEIRAKLPEGPGLWSAFWLIGVDRTTPYSAEIDVFEHYGHAPASFTSGVKSWSRREDLDSITSGNRTNVPPGYVYADFNTWGVAVSEDWIRFYFNRREIWRQPTPDSHRQPMIVLLNLALGPGFPLDQTPNPSFLYVDYVRVWSMD